MFILKGILLGLGLFGICLAIYVIGMTRFLMKGTPSPTPGIAIGTDFVTMLQHNHWVLVASGLHHVGAFDCRLVADACRVLKIIC